MHRRFLDVLLLRETCTMSKTLVEHVYLVHGAPEILVHDHGGEFWSQVMYEGISRIVGYSGFQDKPAMIFA